MSCAHPCPELWSGCPADIRLHFSCGLPACSALIDMGRHPAMAGCQLLQSHLLVLTCRLHELLSAVLKTGC